MNIDGVVDVLKKIDSLGTDKKKCLLAKTGLYEGDISLSICGVNILIKTDNREVKELFVRGAQSYEVRMTNESIVNLISNIAQKNKIGVMKIGKNKYTRGGAYTFCDKPFLFESNLEKSIYDIINAQKDFIIDYNLMLEEREHKLATDLHHKSKKIISRILEEN